MKQWFFSKLLANVSFGKYFITKTFCRFFPPLFFIITKMLCRFFSPPLSPSSFGAWHPLCWAPTGICYRWPFFIQVPGCRRSASHSTVVGKHMLAWDKEVLVHSLSRMPLKPLFNGDVSLSTYWEGRSCKLMRLFLHPCQSCYCWSLATSCTVFFKGC